MSASDVCKGLDTLAESSSPSGYGGLGGQLVKTIADLARNMTSQQPSAADGQVRLVHEPFDSANTSTRPASDDLIAGNVIDWSVVDVSGLGWTALVVTSAASILGFMLLRTVYQLLFKPMNRIMVSIRDRYPVIVQSNMAESTREPKAPFY
jgi:hypothetical protein